MIKISKSITGTDALTLAIAKSWMKVDGTAEDILITSLISQARELIEKYCNTTITLATITLTASQRETLLIPYPPVISITSVKDSDDVDMDYEYNGWYIDFTSVVYSTSILDYTTTTVYDAGMTDVPAGLMIAWQETVLYLYENRGDVKIMNFLSQNSNLQEYRQKIWI